MSGFFACGGFARGVFALCALGVMSTALPDGAGAPQTFTYVHHPVSTTNPAAQFAFDRGLTLAFGYDDQESDRAFREAARLDPSLAMAWWGIALAAGPDINSQPTAKATAKAADAIARAKLLAAKHATPEEREYIDALAARYTSDPKPDFDQLAVGYREAMRAIVAKHPDDADARALYAEAIMDLRPWRLWAPDGSPAPDTPELVSEIEQGLARHPQHIGLLHYYIHALEASEHPERALDAARRLGAQPMEPAGAHLVHMPAHIYLRVGDWPDAIASNVHATHHALDYRLSDDPKQELACSHCADFLTYAYMMDGEEGPARDSAEVFQKLSKDPTNTLAVLERFHEWDDLLVTPEVPADAKFYNNDVHAVRGYWHYGRGLAFVARGRLDRAEAELKGLKEEAALAPAAPVFGEKLDVEHSVDRLEQAGDAEALKMCMTILPARIAEARGDLPQAIAQLRQAVSLQDQMTYGEPPNWPYPVRESLGALLLKQKDAAGAEAVFREGLKRSPNNPRLLLGLSAALHAEGHEAEATQAHQAFAAAWRGDSEPNASEL
jgi:hypothetical protein